MEFKKGMEDRYFRYTREGKIIEVESREDADYVIRMRDYYAPQTVEFIGGCQLESGDYPTRLCHEISELAKIIASVYAEKKEKEKVIKQLKKGE